MDGNFLKYLGLAALVATVIALFVLSTHTKGTIQEQLPPSVSTFFIGKNIVKVRVAGLKPCGTVPPNYTCDVRFPVMPKISWEPVTGAKSYAIVVIDPDAPIGPFYHLVAYDIIKTYWPSPSLFGLNSAGRPGWFPVCPPRGDKAHRYFFVVLALDYKPQLPEGLSAGQLIMKIKDHVIGYGYVCGLYARR